MNPVDQHADYYPHTEAPPYRPQREEVYRTERDPECVKPTFPGATGILSPRRKSPAAKIADIIAAMGDEPASRGEAELSAAVFAHVTHPRIPIDWRRVVALLERMTTAGADGALAIARKQIAVKPKQTEVVA